MKSINHSYNAYTKNFYMFGLLVYCDNLHNLYRWFIAQIHFLRAYLSS